MIASPSHEAVAKPEPDSEAGNTTADRPNTSPKESVSKTGNCAPEISVGDGHPCRKAEHLQAAQQAHDTGYRMEHETLITPVLPGTAFFDGPLSLESLLGAKSHDSGGNQQGPNVHQLLQQHHQQQSQHQSNQQQNHHQLQFVTTLPNVDSSNMNQPLLILMPDGSTVLQHPLLGAHGAACYQGSLDPFPHASPTNSVTSANSHSHSQNSGGSLPFPVPSLHGQHQTVARQATLTIPPPEAASRAPERHRPQVHGPGPAVIQQGPGSQTATITIPQEETWSDPQIPGVEHFAVFSKTGRTAFHVWKPAVDEQNYEDSEWYKTSVYTLCIRMELAKPKSSSSSSSASSSSSSRLRKTSDASVQSQQQIPSSAPADQSSNSSVDGHGMVNLETSSVTDDMYPVHDDLEWQANLYLVDDADLTVIEGGIKFHRAGPFRIVRRSSGVLQGELGSFSPNRFSFVHNGEHNRFRVLVALHSVREPEKTYYTISPGFLIKSKKPKRAILSQKTGRKHRPQQDMPIDPTDDALATALLSGAIPPHIAAAAMAGMSSLPSTFPVPNTSSHPLLGSMTPQQQLAFMHRMLIPSQTGSGGQAGAQQQQLANAAMLLQAAQNGGQFSLAGLQGLANFAMPLSAQASASSSAAVQSMQQQAQQQQQQHVQQQQQQQQILEMIGQFAMPNGYQ